MGLSFHDEKSLAEATEALRFASPVSSETDSMGIVYEERIDNYSDNNDNRWGKDEHISASAVA